MSRENRPEGSRVRTGTPTGAAAPAEPRRPVRPARRQEPKTAREVALYILYHVDTRKAFADLLLTQSLKEGALETRDAALVTEMVNGTLRWRARLDWILGRYVRVGLDTLPPWIRNILRLGLYQILFLDRVPPHAAVDESVKLARVHGHAGIAGLVNAVLRKILKDRESLPDPEQTLADRGEGLSIAYSHPRWLVERWIRRLGEDEARKLLAANNRPAVLCLRVNPGRTDRETLRRALEARGIVTEAGPLSRLSLRVSGNLVPAQVPEFLEGHFFVQDESETLVGELLGAEPGETVLDLCAAPGGKAAHIQEGRRSHGLVLAVDGQRNRIPRIRENIARMGLENVHPILADGRRFALARPVDRVLVDAPCSGLGVLGRRADARWRKTEASMRALLPLEEELLEAGSAWVKPGGVLVYSVCSTEPEEGLNLVRAFLQRHPEFRPEDAAGFVPAEAVSDGWILLYPHRHGTDGAFAARMRRNP
jgi:16S rRNA (cytosine967-C5)-methyltransferase